MKYPEDFINKIICGDCLDILKEIPDKSVELVLTDPPYGITYQGEKRPNETIYNNIENDNKELDYKKVIAELERVGKKVIIFGAENFYKDLPHKGRWMCWDKRVSESADKMLGSAFELAWINVSSGYYKMYRVLHGGVVNDDGVGQRFHPTQKPIRLMKKIILDYSKENDTIIDPFLGSGTTAVAAKALKRNFIGIEISEKYCEIARQRLRQDILI